MEPAEQRISDQERQQVADVLRQLGEPVTATGFEVPCTSVVSVNTDTDPAAATWAR